MANLRRAAPSLLLGTTQAGGNLTLAATAWMVSGLTPSPLLNSLLPALGALPLLLQLKRHPKGYGLQLMAVVLLIGISLTMDPKTGSQTWPLLACYAAVVLFGFGREVSTLPLERRLLSNSNTTMQRLRRGQDMGSLVGNLLAALLFPAIRQFLPALVLLLPMTGLAVRGQKSPEPVESSLSQRLPFDLRCMLQGLVLGGLFALLALWVREVDGGKCFDFAMVLAAYGFGRTAVGLLPRMHQAWRYGLITVLLLLTQSPLPPLAAVLLFIPIGALVASSDAALVDQLTSLGDAPLRWQVLLRSGAIGGVVGSIGLGLICQLLSLDAALPLVMAGFLCLALFPTPKPAQATP